MSDIELRWKTEAPDFYGYFYESVFAPEQALIDAGWSKAADTRKATLKEIIKMYQEYFPTNDDAEWLDIYGFSEMLKHKLEGEDE